MSLYIRRRLWGRENPRLKLGLRSRSQPGWPGGTARRGAGAAGGCVGGTPPPLPPFPRPHRSGSFRDLCWKCLRLGYPGNRYETKTGVQEVYPGRSQEQGLHGKGCRTGQRDRLK